MSEKCAKCGSDAVMSDVRVADALEEELAVEVQTKPHAMFLKGTVRVPLRATVCGACGYAELYATDAARLSATQA